MRPAKSNKIVFFGSKIEVFFRSERHHIHLRFHNIKHGCLWSLMKIWNRQTLDIPWTIKEWQGSKLYEVMKIVATYYCFRHAGITAISLLFTIFLFLSKDTTTTFCENFMVQGLSKLDSKFALTVRITIRIYLLCHVISLYLCKQLSLLTQL